LRSLEYRLYWFYDPFVTPRAERGDWALERKGDLSLFAAPRGAPQPMGMEEIGAAYDWPTTRKGFTYLEAFGFPPWAPTVDGPPPASHPVAR
jgi:hypothetical protein